MGGIKSLTNFQYVSDTQGGNQVPWVLNTKASSPTVQWWNGRDTMGNFLLLGATRDESIGSAWVTGEYGVQVQIEGGEGMDVNVYEVIAIETPTISAQEQGAVSKMILPPTAVLAADKSGAIAEAAKKIKEGFEPSRTRFVVRTFQGA